ncbi:MAG: LysR family transcriptional regulator [Cognaticolwellia sp.]|jgi:DNA-binding transcriptional LysR family regulator|uniref:LysR family transcriptional regulator n=1 Tax=Colwellia sp. 6M3 TaxID=2759849 RepID=UPI0015F3FE58|nr:LysR family transcriptional regulator [Colwellia sp. 6M3]MBA6416893.1 LysR family transcriptional regulator [Colwellia sp. 6M3]|tara:strand:- start:243 stop:1142 length:900 start_codon:yes stop_codon:yes gene_type:complete
MSGINRLDIKQLRVLQLLLQERNLSKVAHIMGLTQQAISEQLKKIRHTFDDEMFIRTSNGVIPTQVAEKMEHRVNQILADIDNLITGEKFNPAELSGILQISSSDYALVTILPMLLTQVNALAPNLKVIIRDFESDNLNQLMVTGELDLVFTFPEFIPENYPNKRLFEDHHVCVTGNNSIYRGKKYSLLELAQLPQIVISPSRPNLKGSHDSWFAKQGIKRHILMSVPSFSAASTIIEATNTIAFLPSRLLPDPKLVAIEIEQNPPKFDVIVAWHQRSNNNPLHLWLLGLLDNIFCSAE